jgi:hypothetical protein
MPADPSSFVYGAAVAAEGFHQVAVVMTTDDARAGRTDAEWQAARDPGAWRQSWRDLVMAAPSPERLDALRAWYRSGYRAFGRGDWELNTAVMHPTDYVFKGGGLADLIPGADAEARGPEGYLRTHQAFLEAWADAEVHLDGVFQAPDGRTVGLPRFVVRGDSSGMEIEHTLADVHTWRDGWLVEQVYWFDRDEGLRSAGIDPAEVGAVSDR